MGYNRADVKGLYSGKSPVLAEFTAGGFGVEPTFFWQTLHRSTAGWLISGVLDRIARVLSPPASQDLAFLRLSHGFMHIDLTWTGPTGRASAVSGATRCAGTGRQWRGDSGGGTGKQTGVSSAKGGG